MSLALVADRSRITTIIAFPRARQVGIQALGGAPGQDDLGLAIWDNARLRLTALIDAGIFFARVARTMPLSEVAKAHETLDAHKGGRIVLTPGARNER